MREEPRPDRLPDVPKKATYRVLTDTWSECMDAPKGTKVLHFLSVAADRIAALRVVPPEGGPRPDEPRLSAEANAIRDAFYRPYAGGQPPSDGMPPQYEEKFAHLAGLPVNWDSYGSPVVSADAIQRAKAWLEGASIVPLNDGGVQIEWHQEGVEFELAFNADGTNDVLFATENSGRKVVRAVPPSQEAGTP